MVTKYQGLSQGNNATHRTPQNKNFDVMLYRSTRKQMKKMRPDVILCPSINLY
jgi:hypothetical protein